MKGRDQDRDQDIAELVSVIPTMTKFVFMERSVHRDALLPGSMRGYAPSYFNVC